METGAKLPCLMDTYFSLLFRPKSMQYQIPDKTVYTAHVYKAHETHCCVYMPL